jgi:hypothetical protein
MADLGGKTEVKLTLVRTLSGEGRCVKEY